MMEDPGYTSYQDPRLLPPDEVECERTCDTCAYYRELYPRDGACVFEVFQADTFDELAHANLREVEPLGAPCEDWRAM